MSDLAASLLGYLGTGGLYSAIVGCAVVLIMPDRTGHRFGGVLAALGGAAMVCEVVAARLV